MKLYLFLLAFIIVTLGYSQDISSNYRSKKVAISDTIVLDTLSINPSRFEILNKVGKAIDPRQYIVNYEKAWVIPSDSLKQIRDSITINYLRYPSFITRKYFVLDPKIIVENTDQINKLYSLEQTNRKSDFKPFDGLSTLGSISRGITIGNNQNAVVNSELDLQITGKLSETVSIRASIQDANIPTQQGGYSQSLDEFDQIFIELYGDNWNIRAGDVDLQNQNSYFARFQKKIQGISLSGTFKHNNDAQTSAYAAGALVRGVFQKSSFVGEEGNQGPYKLIGPNGELFILIVSGSERVYVNGLLLRRGDNADYIIDYNAGEIKFNATYPITANMRILVEYQFTDQSYTRFIGYGGGNYSNEKFDLGVYVYSESDAKNQPLQQNLTEEQVAILKEAGDDMSAMIAPSAVPDTFSENKILYRKDTIGSQEIFVFSSNPDDELFSVRFTRVGDNMGNYILTDASAINNIYEYISPINNTPQGNYAPIIQLNAPNKLQIGGLQGHYHPSEKTDIAFELAVSNNDLNLFSDIDNDDNDGFAGHLTARQTIITTVDSLKIDGFASVDFINENFRTIERLYNVEFERDWNLANPIGDQQLITAGIEVSSVKAGVARYEFQNLNFSKNFSGSRHVFSSAIHLDKFNLYPSASYLNSTGDSLNSKFLRLNIPTTYSFNRGWLGAKVSGEDNQIHRTTNDSLSIESQRYKAYEVFSGIGDSTKIFIELGYQYRVNDSVRAANLIRVNSSNTYYLKSRLINHQNAQLSLFANYRELKDEDGTDETEKSLNTRLIYNQTLFKGGIRWNTVLESNNGVIPQQEFTYVQVDPGQGIYTWNDYNENGIQELDEFEVAQFQDEADYIRILLPNQVFVKVRENKFSQILTLNPNVWQSQDGFKKFLSHFYNQTSFNLDRKVLRDNDGFNINPFKGGGDDELGLSLNLRNVLFYNRSKQYLTTSYTFISTSSNNLLSIGLQVNDLRRHQLNFNHKFWVDWLFNLRSAVGTNKSTSQNFASRNFNLDNYNVNPKISYLLNRQTRFDVFYEFANKENTIGEMETLDQQTIGFSFAYNNAQKISLNGEFNYIDNDFKGSPFSPVAYQMLEGLQPGSNFTWNLLLQKRITKFLDANISYFGRKSENSKTIHTGSIQLRAFF